MARRFRWLPDETDIIHAMEENAGTWHPACGGVQDSTTEDSEGRKFCTACGRCVLEIRYKESKPRSER